MKKYLKYLLPLTLLGGFLTFYKLGAIPSHMQTDEAAAVLNAKEVGSSPFSPLTPLPGGSSPTWLDYIQHATFSLLGTNLFAIRLHAALSSLLSIPVFYFFALYFLKNRRWSAVATAIFATNRLFLTFARIGHATGLQLLFTLLAYTFFLAAITAVKTGHLSSEALAKEDAPSLRKRAGIKPAPTKKSLLLAALSGICLGIEMHTYTSGILIPLVIGITMLAIIVSDVIPYFAATGGARPAPTRKIRRYLSSFATLIFFTVLAGLPRLLMFFAPGNPATARASEVSIFSESLSRKDLVWAFGENVKKIIKLFYWRGELTGKHNYFALPALDYVSFGLFALGVMYLVWKNTASFVGTGRDLSFPSVIARRTPMNIGGRRGNPVRTTTIFLLLALSIPLLANLFTRFEDVPSFLRSYPFIIPIPIFITFGIKFLWEKLPSFRPTYVFLTLYILAFGPWVYFNYQVKELNTRGWLEATQAGIIPYGLNLEGMENRKKLYDEAYNKYLQAVEQKKDFSKPLCLDNGTINPQWTIYSGDANPCPKTEHSIQIDPTTGDFLSVL